MFILWREDESGPLIRTRIMMGTVVEIRLHDRDAVRFDPAVSQAFAAMADIEQRMSPHLSDSEISHISSNPAPVAVSDDTAAVMQLALSVTEASEGAFDVSLGRLVSLWGFSEGEPVVPSTAEIAEALRGTGPGSLRLVKGRVEKKSPQLAVDLGGVAKGYAIDRAIDILAAAGVKHAAVNAGGDMRLLGDRAGVPWRIGIQHPRRDDAVLARLNLENQAVVTSGDYERFFEQDGIRYHHILDPLSGTPARMCQAVTVVADRADRADAMATAVFVLGPQKGMALLERTDGVEGLIIDADGEADASSGLQGVIEWQ
jgi:thiamine biosynthesis lipoprotein